VAVTTPAHALVLTAGLGRRLRPLTDVRAKPAVPVAGEALIRRVLSWLAGQGVREAVLNLHHRPETITRVVGDGSALGLRVRYAWEPTLLGSAGGPRAMLPLLEPASTLIVNGDTLTDLSLEGLSAEHRRSGARVTLAVVDNPDPARYGGVEVDDEGWVRSFLPAGHQIPSKHFVGVQLVEPDVFASLPLGEPASSIGGVYSDLAADDRRALRTHQVACRFLDIGTPADYLETSLALAPGGNLTPTAGLGTRIDPTARLVRTAVWDDVTIEADCTLVDCVVTDGARIPRGSRFQAQALIASSGQSPLLAIPLDGSSGSAAEDARGG
jgi:NDP-sugar pyrophosphorylase family protein|tara:strand:+ start:3660 stop:4637 length:978 start_codon:yes stop_codon:yes gene_type:complete